MVASRRERCRRMVPLQVCLPLVASHHLVPLKSSRTTTSSVTQTTSRLLTFIIRMTFDLILCRLDPKHRRKNVGPEKITAPHNQHCASDQKNQKLAPLVHCRPQWVLRPYTARADPVCRLTSFPALACNLRHSTGKCANAPIR